MLCRPQSLCDKLMPQFVDTGVQQSSPDALPATPMPRLGVQLRRLHPIVYKWSVPSVHNSVSSVRYICTSVFPEIQVNLYRHYSTFRIFLLKKFLHLIKVYCSSCGYSELIENAERLLPELFFPHALLLSFSYHSCEYHTGYGMFWRKYYPAIPCKILFFLF